MNYELMYDIVSGNNPELREKFARLNKPITERELEELARVHLPHHFGKSIHDESASRLQSELTSLKDSLLSGQRSLSSYNNMLGQASGKISSTDPRDLKAIQTELHAIRQMTEAQHSTSTQILDRVASQVSIVADIASDVEAFERAKFIHLATNLANRRGFNKKLAELYGAERHPEGLSLLLCNLLVLEPFEAKELIKVKEAILERFGFAVARAVHTTDFPAWLERPQVGILVCTTAEAEIQKIADQIRRSCLAAFDGRQGKVPAIAARFGCSATHDASTASELVGQAEKALLTAAETTGEKVLFFARLATAGSRKDWMLYRS